MKKFKWQYTAFDFFSQAVDFLNAWDGLISYPQIAANNNYVAVVYRYHRGLAFNDRPTEQEIKEARYT